MHWEGAGTVGWGAAMHVGGSSLLAGPVAVVLSFIQSELSAAVVCGREVHWQRGPRPPDCEEVQPAYLPARHCRRAGALQASRRARQQCHCARPCPTCTASSAPNLQEEETGQITPFLATLSIG